MRYLLLFLFPLSCLAHEVGKSPVLTHAVAKIADCTTGWRKYSAEDQKEGAYPETHVTYYRYVFKVPAGKKISIKVEGEYPAGRYAGFNLYDTKRMDSYAGLADFEMEPDAGSVNPFKENAEGKKNYTVWAEPKEKTSGPNRLVMKEGDVGKERTYELWYRIYEPEDGHLGKVNLPRLTAVDPETGAQIECPALAYKPVSKGNPGATLSNVLPGPGEDSVVNFYHRTGSGLYANRDTQYLAARIGQSLDEPLVTVLRFKPPTTPLVSKDKFDVRYWSLCLGGTIYSITYSCLSDRDAKVDKDGYVTLVIGPKEAKAKVGDGNFLQSPQTSFIVIYRNLLAKKDFKGNFKELPTWPNPDLEDPRNELKASKFIGDYSPTGKAYKLSEYLAGK